jgi:hypothetical protein
MKNRVIRLTESELKRYINKVISEQSTPPPTGGGSNFNQTTPKVPIVGGTPTEKLRELVGKAVLCRASDNSASYKCVIRSAGQTKSNYIYLTVSCENEPKVQWIRYYADDDDEKELTVGGSLPTRPVTCKGLTDWLRTNIKPYMEQYDFAKKGGSDMNADFS